MGTSTKPRLTFPEKSVSVISRRHLQICRTPNNYTWPKWPHCTPHVLSFPLSIQVALLSNSPCCKNATGEGDFFGTTLCSASIYPSSVTGKCSSIAYPYKCPICMGSMWHSGSVVAAKGTRRRGRRYNMIQAEIWESGVEPALFCVAGVISKLYLSDLWARDKLKVCDIRPWTGRQGTVTRVNLDLKLYWKQFLFHCFPWLTP